MKLFKRLIAIAVATTIAITQIGVSAFALSYQERSSAMIQFFANEDVLGNLTDEDIKLFGIYISNFYTPFQTSYDTMGDDIDAAVEKLMGGEIPSGKKEQLESLKSVVISNIEQKSVPLYIKAEGSIPAPVNGDTHPANIARAALAYASKSGSVDFYGDVNGTEHKFFSLYFNGTDTKKFLGYSNQSSTICSAMLAMCIANAVDSQVESQQIINALNGELRITPFGDIISVTTETSYVLVPGCMNPYTWDENGMVVPIMNNIGFGYLGHSLVPEGNPDGLPLNYAAQKAKDGFSNKSAGIYAFTSENSIKSKAIIEDDVDEALMGDDEDDKAGDSGAVESYEAEFLSNQNLAFLFSQYNISTKAFDTSLHKASSTKILGYGADGKEENFAEAMQGLSGVFRDFAYEPISGAKLQDFLYYFSGTKVAGTDTNIAKISIFYQDEAMGSEGGTADKWSSVVKKKASSQEYVREGMWDWNFWFVPLGLKKGPAYEMGGYSCVEPNSNIYSNVGSYAPYPQIFYTYMMTSTNPNLPPVDADAESLTGLLASTIDNSELEELQKDVLESVQGLLEDGTSDKKAGFITDFLNSFVLKAHRTMLGIQSNNIATVSNSGMLYSGFTGHVTTPTLSDFSFTQSIVENYNNIYIALMGCVIVCLIVMLLIHMKSFKQVIVLFLIMAICLAVPQGLIDGAITLSNTISQSMYADRFNYWAMIQHQQEIQEVREAGTSTVNSILVENYSMLKNYYADDSIQLKWMSAKKGDTTDDASVFDSLFDEDTGAALVPGATVFKFLFSGYFKQESYSSDALATYVYRTYSSVAKAAKKLAFDNKGGFTAGSASFGAEALEAVPELHAIAYGVYEVPGVSGYKANVSDTNYRTAFQVDTLNKAMDKRNIWAGTDGSTDPTVGLTEDEISGDNMDMFLLYSESPFYYFYNVFMKSNATGAVTFNGDEYKSAEIEGWLSNMLSEELYTVTEPTSPMYGMRKDFLDMEGLFTYVIPYLYGLNDIVIDFTEARGTDYSKYGEAHINSKEQIKAVWNIYSPWVDALYEATPLNEKIRVVNKQFIVADPLNPLFYLSTDVTSSSVDMTGRPMTFGEADAYVKGVTEANMTNVEMKISNVLENTYTDMRYLANYSVLSDEVLITAAAMMATFNFNQEFSDSGLFHESTVLYPQGYELKTFSYDAFLRMILLNSTGQSVMAKTDIYTAVIENTSFWTGVVLLIVDAFAIYVLPTAKLIFVVTVFILSLLMLMSCFLQGIENAPKTVMQALVFPMLKFLLISILHAVATAMLMGEGLTELVGSKSMAIVTNDPTVTLLLLALINGLASVFFIKILVQLIKDGIQWVKATTEAVVDLGKGLVQTVGGIVATAAVAGAAGATGGAVGAGLMSGLIQKGKQGAEGTGGAYKSHISNSRGNHMPRSWQRRMKNFTRGLDKSTKNTKDKEIKKEQQKKERRAAQQRATVEAHAREEQRNLSFAEDLTTRGKASRTVNKVGRGMRNVGARVQHTLSRFGALGAVAGVATGGVMRVAGTAVSGASHVGHLGAVVTKHATNAVREKVPNGVATVKHAVSNVANSDTVKAAKGRLVLMKRKFMPQKSTQFKVKDKRARGSGGMSRHDIREQEAKVAHERKVQEHEATKQERVAAYESTRVKSQYKQVQQLEADVRYAEARNKALEETTEGIQGDANRHRYAASVAKDTHRTLQYQTESMNRKSVAEQEAYVKKQMDALKARQKAADTKYKALQQQHIAAGDKSYKTKVKTFKTTYNTTYKAINEKKKKK